MIDWLHFQGLIPVAPRKVGVLLGQHTCCVWQELVTEHNDQQDTGHPNGKGTRSPLYYAPCEPVRPVSGKAGCCPSGQSLSHSLILLNLLTTS